MNRWMQEARRAKWQSTLLARRLAECGPRACGILSLGLVSSMA